MTNLLNFRLQNNYFSEYNFFDKEILPGYYCFPQLLLADLANTLLPYVRTEYEHCSTYADVIFNHIPKKGRSTTECAFGKA